MIRIAICDDQEIILKQQETLIRGIFEELGVQIEVETYSDGAQLIQSQGKHDVIFLDIDMPEMDGLSAAKYLRAQENQAYIVFVSSLKERVFDTFKVTAYDFLVKPLAYEHVYPVIQNILKEVSRKEGEYIDIEISHGKPIRLNLKDLLYIETNQRGTKLHLKDRVYESPIKLSDYEKQLADKDFYKIYTSFIVNFKYIKDYCQTHATMSSGIELSMSRRKYGEFKAAYVKYLRRQ